MIGVDTKPARKIPGVNHLIRADIASPNAPAVILREVASKGGRLDALVNNAAVQICKPFLETTVAEWDLVMATNLRAVFLMAKHAYPLLKASKGAIVNVSSVHAVATSKGIAAYAASKGALLALTRAMALELGGDGIRVNAVLPGAVDTPMLRAGLTRGNLNESGATELVRGLGERHALGRIGQPREIGRAILFLAENQQSSFMTGQALVVDGGATARLSTE